MIIVCIYIFEKWKWFLFLVSRLLLPYVWLQLLPYMGKKGKLSNFGQIHPCKVHLWFIKPCPNIISTQSIILWDLALGVLHKGLGKKLLELWKVKLWLQQSKNLDFTHRKTNLLLQPTTTITLKHFFGSLIRWVLEVY